MEISVEVSQATAAQHRIGLMKMQLLSSMSEDTQAVPKLLKKSAGESSCCIFRVPRGLAGGIAEACRPRIVSIGQYHHGEPQLHMLEEHKWRYLRAMLDQTQQRGIGLKDLIDVLTPKEEMIRQCYSESIDSFSGCDLVKMMVLDGCFIIVLLLQKKGVVLLDANDPLLANSYVFNSLVLDLLRLENQVPFFVLEDLFEKTNVTKEALAPLALGFFDCVLKRPPHIAEMHRKLTGVHLLDLVRLSLIPWDQQNRSSSHEWIGSASDCIEWIGSASKLHRMGIRFRQRKANTFLEIRFNVQCQIIEIPKLTINGTLNCILLNMVAFEQCQRHYIKHVTAYVMLMGSLIQTEDDAQLLCDRGVIRNYCVTKEDVARFFRDACKDASCNIQGTYLASEDWNSIRSRYRIWKALISKCIFPIQSCLFR